MSGKVYFSVESAVAVITIENADVGNALTPTMAYQLGRICDEIDEEKGIGAAVIRGANGTFSTGAHRDTLDAIGRDPASDVGYGWLSDLYASFERFGALRVPTIAAIRGRAIGAGFNLMLAADLRIVACDAQISSGFVDARALPGGGHFVLSGRAAGREAAAALGVFGVSLTGQEAADVGYAWAAVDGDAVDAKAFELAARPAASPELSRASVNALREQLGPPMMSWPAAVGYERGAQMWSLWKRVRTTASSVTGPIDE